MKNKTLIIDGNNLLHRAYHKYKNLTSKGGIKSSMVFGFPYVLQSLIKIHKPTEVIIAFDGGRDENRLKVLPTYKQRDSKSDFDYDDFIKQKKDVEKIMGYLGIPFSSKKGLEADDIIWLMARKASRRGLVVIVSSDKDFVQLIDERISLWNPSKGERITHKNCHKYYPFTPAQCVDYLILDGDASDKIPGLKGVGEKTAIKFLNEYTSIKDYLDSERIEKKFNKEELEIVYKRNKQLIDIKYFCKLNKIKLKDIPLTDTGSIDKKELNLLLSDYSINILQKNDFLLTFKNLLNVRKPRNTK